MPTKVYKPRIQNREMYLLNKNKKISDKINCPKKNVISTIL